MSRTVDGLVTCNAEDSSLDVFDQGKLNTSGFESLYDGGLEDRGFGVPSRDGFRVSTSLACRGEYLESRGGAGGDMLRSALGMLRSDIPWRDVIDTNPLLPGRASGAPHEAAEPELGRRVLERARLVDEACNAALEDEAAVSSFGLGLRTQIVLA
jgi:hypothetical protein